MKVFNNLNMTFILHETVTCDDRDPPWVNTWIKILIDDKKILYKKYLRSGKNTKVFEELKLLLNKIVSLTNDSSDRYYIRLSNKLNYSLKHTGQF